MSTTALTPDGTVAAGSWVNTGGAASLEAALADASDATYGLATGAAATGTFNVTTATIPAGANVSAIYVTGRASTTAGTLTLEYWVTSPTGDSAHYFVVLTTTIINIGFSIGAVNPSGAPYTQADLDALKLNILAPAGVRVQKLGFNLYIDEMPVTVVTVPVEASVQTTALPTISGTYTDPDGYAADRLQIRLFDLALTPDPNVEAYSGPPGPDEAATPPLWDSGETVITTASGATWSTTCGVSLVNGGSYRVYARTRSAFGAGGYAGHLWSSWDLNNFTVVFAPAADPTITPTVDDTLARIQLALAGHDNMLTANQAGIETNTTGWAANVNCAIARSTTFAAEGAASLRLTSTAGGTMSAIATSVAVVAGMQCTARASFRSAVSARTVNVYIRWLNAALATISTSAAGTAADTTAGFTQATVTATAPALAVWAVVIVEVAATGGASEVHYVDKIGVAPGTSTVWTPGGLVTTQRIEVQRSIDGGATWEAVRGGVSADLDDPTQTLTIYDYSAPRGASVLYRARITAGSGATAVASAWVTTSAQAPAQSGGFWLKSASDPTKSIELCLDQNVLSSESEEDMAVFLPEGRLYPIVHAGTIRSEVFDPLNLFLADDAEWDAFEALRALQEPVLLQTTYGDTTWEQRWIRLGRRRVTRITYNRMGIEQARRVVVEAREVAEPTIVA